ncbi:expressed unknown protein [Seminavis robusta]|uniref:Uncharacterized protein n=1 Tax=Seminavis robusta TaxID=568900 RepID=A0A9N8H5J1_9STRA|nr:expressed unknown protein [Seminavis robusta]|eukprot:Sro87_g046110.1 n/a (241) ;mRNA; f:76356-77078
MSQNQSFANEAANMNGAPNPNRSDPRFLYGLGATRLSLPGASSNPNGGGVFTMQRPPTPEEVHAYNMYHTLTKPEALFRTLDAKKVFDITTSELARQAHLKNFNMGGDVYLSAMHELVHCDDKRFEVEELAFRLNKVASIETVAHSRALVDARRAVEDAQRALSEGSANSTRVFALTRSLEDAQLDMDDVQRAFDEAKRKEKVVDDTFSLIEVYNEHSRAAMNEARNYCARLPNLNQPLP